LPKLISLKNKKNRKRGSLKTRKANQTPKISVKEKDLDNEMDKLIQDAHKAKKPPSEPSLNSNESKAGNENDSTLASSNGATENTIAKNAHAQDRTTSNDANSNNYTGDVCLIPL